MAVADGEKPEGLSCGTCMNDCEPWTAARKVFSSVLTLSGLAFILYGIGKGYAALPGHWSVHYILFLVVIILLGHLEGLQIALLEMEHMYERLPSDEAFRSKFRRGIATLKLSTMEKGVTIQRFLIGRQFFVVIVVFLCAQLTTFPSLPQTGWPHWLFVGLIDTGLPGALVVLAFGQLMPQLIAASHPLHFMNLFLSWIVVKSCLVLESVGIAHFSWVLASLVRCSCSWKNDNQIHEILLKETKEKDEDDGYVGDLSINHYTQLTVSSAEATLLPMNRAQIKDGARASDQYPLWLDELEQNSSNYHEWGYDPTILDSSFPSPQQIVEYLLSKEQRVPRYLLQPSHSKYIPAYVVAHNVLKREEQLLQKCRHLERRIQELQIGE